MQKPAFLTSAMALTFLAAMALSSCINCDTCARKRAAREAAAVNSAAQTPAPAVEPAAQQAAW